MKEIKVEKLAHPVPSVMKCRTVYRFPNGAIFNVYDSNRDCGAFYSSLDHLVEKGAGIPAMPESIYEWTSPNFGFCPISIDPWNAMRAYEICQESASFMCHQVGSGDSQGILDFFSVFPWIVNPVINLLLHEFAFLSVLEWVHAPKSNPYELTQIDFNDLFCVDTHPHLKELQQKALGL